MALPAHLLCRDWLFAAGCVVCSHSPSFNTSGWGFLAALGIIVVTLIAYQADEAVRRR
jgi:hypothetical protein